MTKLGKRTIFWICWATYVLAYICRMNLSSAMLKMQDGLRIEADLLGIAGGLFFLFYAVGQLINGILGDRVSPYKFILTAVIGTAALNAFISFQTNVYAVMCCWALNGYVQSMFWGPLVRVLAGRFSEGERADVSVGMQTTSLVGIVISWVVLGRVLLNFSWRAYFLAPSLIILTSSAVWIYLSVKGGAYLGAQTRGRVGVKDVFKTVLSGRLGVTALICVCLGLIRDSVTLWLPAMLVNALGIDVKDSLLLLLAVTVVNYTGALLSRKLLMRFKEKIAPVLIFLFLIITLCSVFSAFINNYNPLVSVAMIAVISAMSIGLTTVLLMFLPMTYAKEGIVSSVVGALDFSVYAGAAVSSFVIGMFFTDLNIARISALWAAVGALAVALCCALHFLRFNKN